MGERVIVDARSLRLLTLRATGNKKTLAMAATPRYAMVAAGAEDRTSERAIDEGCHSIARSCNVQVLCLEYSTGQ